MEPENQQVARRLTDKQAEYLKSLAESRALEDADREFLLEHMGEFDVALASKWIDSLKRMPPKPKPKDQGKWAVPDAIPDGRYAVYRKPIKAWLFFRVVTKEDRRDGLSYRVVQRLHGAPGDFRYSRVTTDEWQLAVNEIGKDPGLHSTLFGLKVGACGICGSPLTDPTSIAMGIGPICARKYGWFDGEPEDGAE
jgi:hypothetical protein